MFYTCIHYSIWCFKTVSEWHSDSLFFQLRDRMSADNNTCQILLYEFMINVVWCISTSNVWKQHEYPGRFVLYVHPIVVYVQCIFYWSIYICWSSFWEGLMALQGRTSVAKSKISVEPLSLVYWEPKSCFFEDKCRDYFIACVIKKNPVVQKWIKKHDQRLCCKKMN